jgi:hypothetical protein
VEIDKKELKEIALRLISVGNYKHMADVWTDATQMYLKRNELFIIDMAEYLELKANSHYNEKKG